MKAKESKPFRNVRKPLYPKAVVDPTTRKAEASVKSLIKFGLVGASGTVINLSILYALTSWVNLPYLVSNAVGFVCALCWTYFWNSRVTFKRPLRGALLLRYAAAVTCGFLLGEALLWLFTEQAHLFYMASAVLSVGIFFLFNYTLSRKFVWREQHEATI